MGEDNQLLSFDWEDSTEDFFGIAQKTVDDENAELFSQFGAINEIQEQKKKLVLMLACSVPNILVDSYRDWETDRKSVV